MDTIKKIFYIITPIFYMIISNFFEMSRPFSTQQSLLFLILIITLAGLFYLSRDSHFTLTIVLTVIYALCLLAYPYPFHWLYNLNIFNHLSLLTVGTVFAFYFGNLVQHIIKKNNH